MTISWSFSYKSFVKFHGKKKILEPNLCDNEVCYKGTVLYYYFHSMPYGICKIFKGLVEIS